MKKKFTTNIVLLFIVIFSLVTGARLEAAPIRGLEFLGEAPSNINIGELFVKIYNFGIGLVALAAFIALVLAGVLYLTAGDNESRATQAKQWIWNAVIGLVIALLSYLILFSINPDLVKDVNFALPNLDGTVSCTQDSDCPQGSGGSTFKCIQGVCSAGGGGSF
jgi:cytochrome bd-type quinol oxidase subunit 2